MSDMLGSQGGWRRAVGTIYRGGVDAVEIFMAVRLPHGSDRERVLYNQQINLVDEVQSESSVLWRFQLTISFSASVFALARS